MGLAGALVDDVVDAAHQPREEGRVERLGHSVTGVQGLVDVERREDSLIPRLLKGMDGEKGIEITWKNVRQYSTGISLRI